MVCVGCGAEAAGESPFVCPGRGDETGDGTGDEADVQHVLRRVLSGSPERLASGDEDNPFLRYRDLLYAHAFGRARGAEDEALVALVRELDQEIVRVDGSGFARTPLTHEPALARALELGPTLYVKDETQNVSGSHKGRHLMEVMSFLRVAELVGAGPDPSTPLGIASCGNAALAAAVIARAAGRALNVFIPAWADENVVARLSELGAELVVCERRDGELGDPCTLRLGESVRSGMIPFSCQGPDNGVAVVGGLTLGYELVEQVAGVHAGLDHLFIQVGGGALASGCVQALKEAHQWGLSKRVPKVHAVQAEGGHPLVRAYDELLAKMLDLPVSDALDTPTRARRAAALSHSSPYAAERAVHYATHHRSELMWPWETAPTSIATGILDDETYDWLAVIEGMLHTGGYPIVVSEAELERARSAVRLRTSVVADATGAAGLAGAYHLGSVGELEHDKNVAVLLTGHDRSEESS